jgi:ATP-dependent exoDNAse (exonuclease V) beta subunit
LVIVKDKEIILLDYKTSNTQNVEKTAQNYRTQLDCYANALSKTLGLPVTKKFLYFFLQQMLILVDKPI